MSQLAHIHTRGRSRRLPPPAAAAALRGTHVEFKTQGGSGCGKWAATGEITRQQGGGSLKLQEDSALGESLWGVQGHRRDTVWFGKGCSGVRPPTAADCRTAAFENSFFESFRTDKAKFQLSGPSGANAANGAKRREGVKLDMRLLRNGFRIQMGPLHAEEVRHEEPATATRGV